MYKDALQAALALLLVFLLDKEGEFLVGKFVISIEEPSSLPSTRQT